MPAALREAIVWRTRLMNTLSAKSCAQSRAVLLPYPAWTAKPPAISFDSCITIGSLQKIQQAIDGVVDHTTLHDMISDYRTKHPKAENI